MCGIFGYIGKKTHAPHMVLEGLKTLEYRGYDSWGIAWITQSLTAGKIEVVKHIGKIADTKNIHLPTANIALGHTRWATHGGVTVANAHPHLSEDHRLALIHNGIIENYSEIKQELIKKGHVFLSETDTEVALHLIEDYYKDSASLLSALHKAFSRFEGLSAIIVMDAKTKKFAAVKNGSPLVVGIGNDGNYLASDAHAILPYTQDVYFMEDGDYIQVDGSSVDVYDSSLNKKSVRYSKLDWKLDLASKGTFPHFMIKEIHDQVGVLETIIRKKDGEIHALTQEIEKSFGTYFVGCGSAAYAALAGTYLFSKIAKYHVNFAVGSEFGFLADFLTDKSLVIALSQSGETVDVIESIKKAKEKKARIASLVNVIGSTLYRESDVSLLLSAGVEKAVVSTKAFTAKLAHLILIAYDLSGNIEEGRKYLRLACESVREVLSPNNIKFISNLAKELSRKEHIYIIGRGLSYPIALETAMKIKESSYIHAEGFAAGELKHGVIALIEKDTPCIAFVPLDESHGSNLAGAMELKARGGKIIGISPEPHDVFDTHLSYKDAGVASLIPSVITGQLLGYYLALERNVDPDMPRNLAKSVTVK